MKDDEILMFYSERISVFILEIFYCFRHVLVIFNLRLSRVKGNSVAFVL